MTYLLIPQTNSNENLTTLLHISNALIQSGNIVYTKTSPNQTFPNIRFDQTIDIGVRPQQNFQNSQYTQNYQNGHPQQFQQSFQQYPNPQLNQQFNYRPQPILQQFPTQQFQSPVQFPQQSYPQPQFSAPLNPQQGSFPQQNFQQPQTPATTQSYPQPQNFNLLPKAGNDAITPLPVELKANNLPEFTPSPTVKK